MFKRAAIWHKNLAPSKKLGFSFLVYWMIWFLSSWLIKDGFFPKQKHSLGYYIFDATWMAFFFAILFDWNNFKSIFRKR